MHYTGYGEPFNFTVHLSTSELVSMLVVDAEALRNEHHEPGIYDETGDYVPQYCDNPDDMPDLQPNNSPSETPAASAGPEGPSADSSDTLSESPNNDS